MPRCRLRRCSACDLPLTTKSSVWSSSATTAEQASSQQRVSAERSRNALCAAVPAGMLAGSCLVMLPVVASVPTSIAHHARMSQLRIWDDGGCVTPDGLVMRAQSASGDERRSVFFESHLSGFFGSFWRRDWHEATPA